MSVDERNGFFSQDKRVNQCLLEIQHLKSKMFEMEQEMNSMRDRFETEKSLNRELLIEKNKLKAELQSIHEEKDKNSKQVTIIPIILVYRAHIQSLWNKTVFL